MAAHDSTGQPPRLVVTVPPPGTTVTGGLLRSSVPITQRGVREGRARQFGRGAPGVQGQVKLSG